MSEGNFELYCSKSLRGGGPKLARMGGYSAIPGVTVAALHDIPRELINYRTVITVTVLNFGGIH